MDLQNRLDYGHWGPTPPSNSQLKKRNVNAWTKKKEVKKMGPSDPKQTKYSSIKFYMRDILKQSLITSIPEITVSKSWSKKAVKIIVFILCLIGFIYQTMDFLWLYLSYPTVVNVLVSNPFEIIQPAITVCNRNRERRSAVCSSEGVYCSTLEEETLCTNYPKYCPNGKEPYPKIPFVNIFIQHKWKWEQENLTAHDHTIIYRCSKTSEGIETECKVPYRRVPVVTSNGEPNFCYTMESLWGEPNAELDTYPNTFYFSLELKTQPEEYIIYSEPVLIQIAVHDRRRLVNPYSEGYALKGGVQYEATVFMTEKKLLPAPYDTNCTDYLKLWRENNGTGPMNDLMCIEYCKLNSLLKEGKCIDKNVAYPNTEEICESGKITATSDIIENCVKSCGSPCSDYSYEVRYDEVNNYDHVCKNDWCRVSNIKLTIFFKRLRLTKFQYQPKFESVEMFSYIGGYMGMWLGLSLVSLFDFFETLFYILYFPIGRWKWLTGKKNVKRSFKHDEVDNHRLHIY